MEDDDEARDEEDDGDEDESVSDGLRSLSKV